MKKPQSLPLPLSKLTLEGDGSFTASNYPGIALGEFGGGANRIDGQGKWSVEHYRNSWIIRIEWENIAGDNKRLGDMLHILNEQPPYALHHIIGDPDTGEALILQKLPAPK